MDAEGRVKASGAGAEVGDELGHGALEPGFLSGGQAGVVAVETGPALIGRHRAVYSSREARNSSSVL